MTAHEGEYLLSDRPWRADDTGRFVERECRAVFLVFRRDVVRLVTLDFLKGLPGLRRVAVDGPMRDDTLVFELSQLEGLGLRTGSQKPLLFDRCPALDTVAVDDRPGLESLASLGRLRNLTVGRYQRPDLTFLGGTPEFIRIEGRYKPLRLDGVERCGALDELAVFDTSVESLEPLRGLAKLRQVEIGTPRAAPPEPWDLSVLHDLPSIEWFTVGGPVRSPAPLYELPQALKRLAFGTVEDGDLTPLLSLPPRVELVSIEDHSHYTHTIDEINELRGAAS